MTNISTITEFFNLSTLTLATAGPDGLPHAAPVYFAARLEPLALYFFSDPDSQHGRDLAHNPQAAAAIYPQCFDWQELRGLQLRGSVLPLLPGSDWEAAWSAYRVKFPFVEKLREIVARNRFYVFTPTWMRLVDNRRGFGFKEEWEF